MQTNDSNLKNSSSESLYQNTASEADPILAESPEASSEAEVAEPSPGDSASPESDSPSVENPDPHTPEESNSIARVLFEYVEMFSIALCAVLLMFMFAFRLCDVRGESMEKTLFEGEKLLVSNLFYTPERGDIIIFHQTGDILNEPIVKRVIATGGEWIDIDFQTSPQKITIKIYDANMNLITVLDESEYAYLDTRVPMRLSDFDYPMQIPEGYLFVLGDNRNHSTDSRSHVIGLVDERRILGKVLMRLYPLDVAGSVD